ncbi:MAG: Fur family transcriptional regulator [Myxococcales bacterium]|jgi:Fur family peroxide stress response transcriptional regulator
MSECSQDRLVGALRSAGLKLTRQRLALVDCLAGDPSHPTAQQLHQRLEARFPDVALATVYNTLGALTAIGACRRLELGGSSRFDPNIAPHDHAVCDGCGCVQDVAPPVSNAAAAPEARGPSGFRVRRVERVFRGLCAQCARAARV